jgi:hypothetical protein
VGQFFGLGRHDFEHQITAEGASGVANPGSGGDIRVIGDAGRHTRTGLNLHRVALGNQFFYRFWGHGDTGFACRSFGRYAYLHGIAPEG